MAQEPQERNFVFDTINLIKFTWEKKWILLTISIAAFIISTIIAFSIKPKFKSKIILFPGAEISLSKTLVETAVGSNNEKDVITFGMDIDAERLMQVVRSEDLTDHLIEKFQLLKYYGVEQSHKKYPLTTVKGILGSNIKFRRTEFNSIEIQVIDHDPQMAADIANEIASYTDTIFYKITNSRSKHAYEIVLDEYNKSQLHIKDLTDSLNKIRAFGINDYERQAEAFNKAYATSILKKDSESIKTIEKKLEILQKYGSNYDELKLRLEYYIKRLSLLEGKLATAKVNYEHKFPNVFVVDKAVKAEKKDGPKRIIIVFISTVSAFVLALLVLIIENYYKNRL